MVDILKRPIIIGDTILIKGHYSVAIDTIHVVDHITPSGKVRFKNPTTKWDSESGKYVPHTSVLYRAGYDCLVISAQLAANKQDHPEAYI